MYDKNILTFPMGQLVTNCYMIVNGDDALIIDPADRADFLYAKLSDKKLKLKYILLTHAHFDHMLAAEKLRKLTSAPLCVHELDAQGVTVPEYSYLTAVGITHGFAPADRLLKDGQVLTLGDDKITVIHTPGHTKGSCCFAYANDVFSGDTIFDEGCGRCDLYGGSETQMQRSLSYLHGKYDGTGVRFHPGHGNSFTL